MTSDHKKKDPRDMTMDELLQAADRMPAYIREWFDERVAIIEHEAGLETEQAVRTAFILARAEYRSRQANRKGIENALALISEACTEFRATIGRFVVDGEPGPNGTVVRVSIVGGESI